MAIETLMMTFGRPKQAASPQPDEKKKKENNNKLKATHTHTHPHSEQLCAFPFPARPRKHYKSFLAGTWRCLAVPPSRPLAFLRGIQPIDRLRSLVKKIKQQRKKNDAQTNYASQMERNEATKQKILPKSVLKYLRCDVARLQVVFFSKTLKRI